MSVSVYWEPIGDDQVLVVNQMDTISTQDMMDTEARCNEELNNRGQPSRLLVIMSEVQGFNIMEGLLRALTAPAGNLMKNPFLISPAFVVLPDAAKSKLAHYFVGTAARIAGRNDKIISFSTEAAAKKYIADRTNAPS